MTENEVSTSGDLVFTPCLRAFFVYYLALFLLWIGPWFNPDVGLPVWLGFLVGLIIVGLFIYQKFGSEYLITDQGVARTWRWPSPRRQDISWENLGDIRVVRGMTQTLLQVGNLVFTDKSGGRMLFWYGLGNPHDIKDQIDRKRPQ